MWQMWDALQFHEDFKMILRLILLILFDQFAVLIIKTGEVQGLRGYIFFEIKNVFLLIWLNYLIWTFKSCY